MIASGHDIEVVGHAAASGEGHLLAERLALRVMTWNLWWRFGDWRRRHERIERVLQDARPDLVGLQEVWGTTTETQAQRLADDLGMHHAWLPSPMPEFFQRRIGDSGIDVGNAVLSRWPITGTSAADLPSGDGDAGRTAILTRIDAPVGAVSFATTQLSSAVGGSAIRCAQVRALAAFIAEQAPSGAACILTGDLNAEPDSDEVRLLSGHKTPPAVPGQVFVDAWLYADPNAPGCTWDRTNPAVDATGEPNARIDYVLVRHQIGTGPPPRVRSARLAGATPIDDLWPSDHAAVVVDLTCE